MLALGSPGWRKATRLQGALHGIHFSLAEYLLLE